MIKLFKDSFGITYYNIILATPLVLFMVIVSMYLGFSKNTVDTLPEMLLSMFTLWVMFGAFLAAWFFMVKRAVENSKSVYILDEDHANELENIRNLVEDVSINKRRLDQYMRNVEPYPYSELLEKLKLLENGTREISSRINSFNDYLISLKKDSELAYKNIQTKYELLKEHEKIIRDLKVEKYVDYFQIRFEDCYALIDDISKILMKVPIDVNQVNQYQRELNDKANNLVKEIQDLDNYRRLASEDILLVNRDRMKFAEINNIISQAETLYLSGDFKSAYEMSEQALNKLNFRDKQ